MELTSTDLELGADARSQTDTTTEGILFSFIKTARYLQTNFFTENTTPVGQGYAEK
jgi:hypothetical protein